MTSRGKPVTVPDLRLFKSRQEKIVVVTAYDATLAHAAEEGGVDALLVGDSLGNVIQGHETTLPVSLDQMVYHGACVARGTRRPLRIVDLPFMTYATVQRALESAQRLVQEGGAQMVKLEGGTHRLEVVEALASQDIPVCGHLGLLPQSIHQLGSYHIQGRSDADADALKAAAGQLQAAGASALVLECVPQELAAEITRGLDIPVIGIGAGPACDGQVLVAHDLLGLTAKCPRFCRNFLEGQGSIAGAFAAYAAAVRSGLFPAPEHAF